MNVIQRYKNDLEKLLESFDEEALENACQLLLSAYRENRQIFVAGNGGSAGTANHFSCDFGKNAVKSQTNRPKILSLSANVEVLTALGNDFSYADVFTEQLKNQMSDGDVILLISASGNSPNVVSAAEYVKSRGGTVIGMTGFSGGRLRELSDVSLHVSCDSYEESEDLHLILTHMIVCWFKEKDLGNND
ncbi:MAG: SIS domain-containing protein [Clostridia bacterium]|nr:SIS domain-containing protein [Clostridia bacterium]